MARAKTHELPHLVPPSGKGGSWPVEKGTEIWEADFMDMDGERHFEIGTDRSRWPPQEKRDLIVEMPVRSGEIPNEVVWSYAHEHLGRPFRGNLRRIR